MKKYLLVFLSLSPGFKVQYVSLSDDDDIDSILKQNAESFWDDYHCFVCEVYEVRPSGFLIFNRCRVFVEDHLYFYLLWNPAECSLGSYFQKCKLFGAVL